jgi:hypothetical protein
MILRLIVTLGLVAFAIGAFLGAGPTQVTPNPFGLLFLGLSALAWFGWKSMMSGLDGRDTGTLDAFTRNNLGDTPRKKGDI